MSATDSPARLLTTCSTGINTFATRLLGSLSSTSTVSLAMGAHTHQQSDNVQSSPASVRHYQTRDHSRNNPDLYVKPKADTDRRNMMSDAINTSIPVLFENMMKTYLPSVDSDGFNDAYPADKIQRIHAKLKQAVRLRSADCKGRRKEQVISDAWVSHCSVSLAQPTTSTVHDHSSRSTRARNSAPATFSTSPRTTPTPPTRRS